MQYYVRELFDKRALLIAEDGYPLAGFDNVTDAVSGCIVHCRVAPIWIEWFSETGDRDSGAVSLDRFRRAEEVFPVTVLARAS